MQRGCAPAAETRQALLSVAETQKHEQAERKRKRKRAREKEKGYERVGKQQVRAETERQGQVLVERPQD